RKEEKHNIYQLLLSNLTRTPIFSKYFPDSFYKISNIIYEEEIMKRLVSILTTLSVIISASLADVIEVSGTITENTTWTSDNEYLLVGQTFVDSGVVLTIEPGTVIKANSDDGTGLAPCLVITRGAKIIADGTKEHPITFTSSLPEDELPQRGTWGGLIILGNAPTNQGESFVEGLIGVPYGGNNPDDSSGVLRYVRVWYGGAVIGQDNEINGITFAGVGRKTVVEHCEVAWNLDDGFEFFGGTVNVRYLSAIFCGDDAFDTDEGYQGKGQFLFTIMGQDMCGRGFEMDNDGNNMDNQPRSFPQFANVTLIGPGGGNPANDGADEMIRLREGTAGDFRNILIVDGNGYGLRVKDDITISLIGDSLKFSPNSIIYNCLLGQFHPDVSSLLNAREIDPVLRSLEGRESDTGIIDPRPQAGSPAFQNVDELPDDGFFEQTDFIGAFGEELWLKGWSWLDEAGRLPDETTIDIEDEIPALDFRIIRVYPNPFNPIANIQFEVKKTTHVKGEIIDLSGRIVKELFNREFTPGIYNEKIRADNLSSGIYIIRMTNGNNNTYQKMSIIK
ncbi:MAG: hypothetical protein DRP15_03760, partial [Candidatus Aenigmatarchaeota archaeon]